MSEEKKQPVKKSKPKEKIDKKPAKKEKVFLGFCVKTGEKLYKEI